MPGGEAIKSSLYIESWPLNTLSHVRCGLSDIQMKAEFQLAVLFFSSIVEDI
jgi:hypothetical protein